MADKSLFNIEVEQLDGFREGMDDSLAKAKKLADDLKTFAKPLNDARDALKSLGPAGTNEAAFRYA